MSKPKPTFKLWFETREGYIFGQGTFELLQKVQELGSLSAAAKALGMSYRYAWGVIKETEEQTGKPLLKTYRGGRSKGGATLTQAGREIIRDFSRMRKVIESACMDDIGWEGLFTKISARNKIPGRIVSIAKGDVGASVKIKVEVPCIVTSFITREAVEDLGIKEGDEVYAVVKATEVMISKEE